LLSLFLSGAKCRDENQSNYFFGLLKQKLNGDVACWSWLAPTKNYQIFLWVAQARAGIEKE